MSYCDLRPVGINFNEGFGPQPGDLIRNTIDNATCLDQCICFTQMDVDWTSEMIGQYPYVVSFTDLSDFPGGGIQAEEWNWTFGDGLSSTEQHPTHTYDKPGDYEVCLDIVDSEGCVGQFCRTISIESCSCDDFEIINAPLTVWDNSNGPHLITKHLIIEEGSRLDFSGTTVRFLTNCKILVKRNARLNILNSSLVGTSCGEPSETPYPWAGIQVWGTQNKAHPDPTTVTNDLAFLSPDHGIVYTNNAYISNVKDTHADAAAIDAGPSWPFAPYLPSIDPATWEKHFGGIVITRFGTFFSCDKAIQLQKYPKNPIPGMNTASYCYGTTFSSIPGRSIWNGQWGLNVINCHFNNSSLIPGSFGISCPDAKLSVYGCDFTNLMIAIDALQTISTNYPVNIGDINDATKSNTFTNCRLGLSGIALTDFNVGYNSFYRSPSLDPYYAGVYTIGPSNFRIKSNQFDNLWAGTTMADTWAPWAKGNLICNEYTSNVYGMVHEGSQYNFWDHEDFDDSGTDAWMTVSQTSNMNIPDQGDYFDPAVNYFSTQIPWSRAKSIPVGNAFNYYYPEDPQTDRLLPHCASNESPLCTPTSVHENVEALTELNEDPDYCLAAVAPPTPCPDLPCLEPYRDQMDSLRSILADGDGSALHTALLTDAGSAAAFQMLLAASPYLSDGVLLEIISASAMSEADKTTLLTANAPLNTPVRLAAESQLSPTSVQTILAVAGPSARRTTENATFAAEHAYWASVRHLAMDGLTPTNATSQLAFLSTIPEPEAIRIRYTAEVALGQYTQAAITLSTLATSDADWVSMQQINLGRLQDPFFALDSTQINYLEGFESQTDAQGALARALLILLDGRYYLPDLQAYGANAGRIFQPIAAPVGEKAPSTMKLVPNPATGSVTLWTGHANADPQGRIRIYDAQGMLLHDQTGYEPMQSLDISQWRPGQYIITVSGKDGFQAQNLIIQ